MVFEDKNENLFIGHFGITPEHYASELINDLDNNIPLFCRPFINNFRDKGYSVIPISNKRQHQQIHQWAEQYQNWSVNCIFNHLTLQPPRYKYFCSTCIGWKSGSQITSCCCSYSRLDDNDDNEINKAMETNSGCICDNNIIYCRDCNTDNNNEDEGRRKLWISENSEKYLRQQLLFSNAVIIFKGRDLKSIKLIKDELKKQGIKIMMKT